MTHYSYKKQNLKILSNILFFTGVGIIVFVSGPYVLDEFMYSFRNLKSQRFVVASGESENKDIITDSVFARLLSTRPISITPVNKDFALVIEKIGVNVPVVKDVSVVDEKAYIEALRSGVAHAITSKYPSEKPGNVYLFAHSSLNYWRLGKYANVFNLLRKLEIGDRVHLFYKGKTYVYEVVNKEVHKGWNTYPLTRPTIEPILTLQTCDPPGTTLNRLVVTSRLIEVK